MGQTDRETDRRTDERTAASLDAPSPKTFSGRSRIIVKLYYARCASAQLRCSDDGIIN